MDRLGIRRVMVTSLALVATGVALTTVMTASWQLALLWGVVVGLGTGTMASVLGAIVANRWFTERRGLVLGLLTASSATGQLLFLPLLASMVVRLGWRSAVLLVAGVALVVLPLVALLMRDDPRDVGLRPFGAPAGPIPARPPPAGAAAAPAGRGHVRPRERGHHVRLDRCVSPARGGHGGLRWRAVADLARRLSGDLHERRSRLSDCGGPRAPHRPGVAPGAGTVSGGRRSLNHRVRRSLALAAALVAVLAVPRNALAHARLVTSDPPDLCAGVPAPAADSRCVPGVVVAAP